MITSQTLHEVLRGRFEKTAILKLGFEEDCFETLENGEYALYLTHKAWNAYQSGAEDNQCMVKLPKIIEVKDQKYPYDVPFLYYSANEVIAAIKAAGGMVKI